MNSNAFVALATGLVVDDGGQDLVEYALLSAIIAVAGVLLVPSITTKMGNAFVGWGTQVQALWIPSAPQ